MEVVQLIVQNKMTRSESSETVGNGRKQSETVGNELGNMIRPKLGSTRIFLNKHFRATPFCLLKVQRLSKGKPLETVGDRTFARQKSSCFVAYVHKKCLSHCVKTCFCRAKVRSPTVSNGFPLDTFGPSKKNGVARKCLLKKNARLNKFWCRSCFRPFPDCFRPFPTVSFFLND